MLLDPVEALEDMVDCSGLKLVVLMVLLACFGGSLEASALVFLMLVDDLSLLPSQHLVLDEVVFYHEGDHHDDDGRLDLDAVVPYHEEVDQH